MAPSVNSPSLASVVVPLLEVVSTIVEVNVEVAALADDALAVEEDEPEVVTASALSVTVLLPVSSPNWSRLSVFKPLLMTPPEPSVSVLDSVAVAVTVDEADRWS